MTFGLSLGIAEDGVEAAIGRREVQPTQKVEARLGPLVTVAFRRLPTRQISVLGSQ